ncbi:unnamed protein product [Rhizoctonia solani]|uniref:RING-type domain-containing protein n=1 Tax=Rhizoctonia solani TaxID=456999 RepID=A0A8H3HAW4_9AGAM|nr:unnamed protein product [Rhizoctonia solani]
MSARAVIDNTIYLDHTPEELPRPSKDIGLNEMSVPPLKHFKDKFAGETARNIKPDDVDDYYSQFYCPICHVWRTSGDSRAIRHCGHVVCVMCWNAWARTSRTGPEHDRITTCPICRIRVSHSETREIDFRATRFNCNSTVITRLVKTIAEYKEENKVLQKALEELQDAVAVLEKQREMLVQMRNNVTGLAAGVESLVLDD